MPNPQAELFQMLAESDLRITHMRSLHKSSHEKNALRQQQIQQKLTELRAAIQAKGLGNDPKSENEYLELLEDLDYLDQSYELGKQYHDKHQGSKRLEPAAEIPEKLSKAIQYGRMLVSVYGDGALVKGAGSDLADWAQRLENLPYAEAKQVAAQLRKLL